MEKKQRLRYEKGRWRGNKRYELESMEKAQQGGNEECSISELSRRSTIMEHHRDEHREEERRRRNM